MTHSPVPPVAVVHNASRERFEATVDGHLCVADYRLDGPVMHMTHTEVPPALQGRGIAARLVQAAIDHARAAHLKINPQCSYVRVYMQRHPDTLSLRA